MHQALRLGYDVLLAFNSYTATHKRSHYPLLFSYTGLLCIYVSLTVVKAIYSVCVWAKAGNFALKIFVSDEHSSLITVKVFFHYSFSRK
jgi:hypothetical protein